MGILQEMAQDQKREFGDEEPVWKDINLLGRVFREILKDHSPTRLSIRRIRRPKKRKIA
jgi:hypothetical protein